MIDFDFNEDCCSCGVCTNICPVQAIRMEANSEGFQIPRVDAGKCTNCGLCEMVCPHLHKKPVETACRNSWLYVSQDTEAKKRSSSGAAFYELAKAGLEKGMYICGCVWDEQLTAEHIVANTQDDLIRMQGSKYVQSDTKKVYAQIGQLLKEGHKVLFSGVPCQCTAVSNYVERIRQGKYRDNLITVAVICHGVASPLAWDSFKKWTSSREKSRLIGVNFRDKTVEGYQKSYCRYDYANGKSIFLPTFLPSSKYMEATLVYNLAIRNSCAHCDCKGNNGSVDLILGDWYREYRGKGALGTSCIAACTERGEKFALEHLTGLEPIEYAQIVQENGLIEKSVKLGKNRSSFLKNVHDYRMWDKVEKLYPGKYPIKKMLVKTGLYDILKGRH